MSDTPVFSFDKFETARAEEGVEIEIRDLEGEPSGLFITILGQDSAAYKTLARKAQVARTRSYAKAGMGAADRVDKLVTSTEQTELDMVVICSIAWRDASGCAMPFDIGKDKVAAKAFYENPKYGDVYDQVRVGIHSRALFMKASAK